MRYSSCWTACLSALALLFSFAGSAGAQKLQWTDVVYQRGRWVQGQFGPPAGKDTLGIQMRIDYFAQPPRWRAELRRTVNGVSFGEPTVLLGDKRTVKVVTPLGTTPLEKHALSRDSLVLSAIVFDAAGRRIGPANGTIAHGDRVVFRRTAKTATFASESLDPRKPAATRQLLSRSLTTVGDQRSATVVATAGARGVDKVKTAHGDVAVKPDSIAVIRMDRFAVSAVKLEDFMRVGFLGPYRRSTP